MLVAVIDHSAAHHRRTSWFFGLLQHRCGEEKSSSAHTQFSAVQQNGLPFKFVRLVIVAAFVREEKERERTLPTAACALCVLPSLSSLPISSSVSLFFSGRLLVWPPSYSRLTVGADGQWSSLR